MPGYTHLQRAQPVTLGHHLLAWVEMLERDRARFAFARSQATPSPLGAGALAGSTLPLPAPPNAMRNSIDAVGDRDFALDYLYAVATLFTHLSRIGEELVLWTSSEFGFARLPEEAATGSSIMPQKLNPDVAELARGKAGTAIGRLTGLLATVKSLPLAYDRDLQEDKPPVFAARRDTGGALGALTVLVSGLTFVHGRLAAATADPLLRATDAAEALVADGRAVPRRARAGRRPGARRIVRGAARGRAPRRRGGRGRRGAGALVMTTPLEVSLAGRDFLRISDLVPAEAEAILDHAVELRRNPKQPLLPGATLGLYFAKHSTRTRVSFSAGMAQLGGAAIHLAPEELQLSRGESLPDTARALSRLPRCARRARPLACRARGVGALGVDPGDQRADGRGASVPGTRRRADDARPPRLARRRARRVGRRRLERLHLARAARPAARLRGGRRLPGGIRARGRRAARARSARGRARRGRDRHRHLGEHGAGGGARPAGA